MKLLYPTLLLGTSILLTSCADTVFSVGLSYKGVTASVTTSKYKREVAVPPVEVRPEPSLDAAGKAFNDLTGKNPVESP